MASTTLVNTHACAHTHTRKCKECFREGFNWYYWWMIDWWWWTATLLPSYNSSVSISLCPAFHGPSQLYFVILFASQDLTDVGFCRTRADTEHRTTPRPVWIPKLKFSSSRYSVRVEYRIILAASTTLESTHEWGRTVIWESQGTQEPRPALTPAATKLKVSEETLRTGGHRWQWEGLLYVEIML